MQNYQSFILNTLLNKYEKSKHGRDEAKVNRKVAFPFTAKTFPDYFIDGLESPRPLINEVTQKMEQEGFILITWVKFEKGNLIEQVHLNLERVQDSYKALGRTPLRDEMSEAVTLIESCMGSYKSSWIIHFLNCCLDDLAQKKMPAPLSKGIETFEMLLQALSGIESQNGVEIPERLFSTRYFGKSKTFEKVVRSRLESVLLAHYPIEQEEREWIDSDSLLRLAGL